MQKTELLLPAGNEECLRAAVNNGANAVYLGLSKFSARKSAGNFNEKNVFGAIDYCHKRDVMVYIALNTLVKNHELEEYFRQINIAYMAKADAVIIQDPCFIPLIQKNFPSLKIHLSTQATNLNSFSIPEGVERVVLERELPFDEVRALAKKCNAEVFVHGALCFSYSGQCLFSSIAGGRSGNRGLCAQPCRMTYNNRYVLSTMDLCLLQKIPELIKAGIVSFKIEGRMRNPFYVATCARIYRKYIDQYYNNSFSVTSKDIEDLKLAFNREFTEGFGFTESIVDSRAAMNRGLFLGILKDGKILLKTGIKIGDGIALWLNDGTRTGNTIKWIKKDNVSVSSAVRGELVELDIQSPEGRSPAYKTSSVDKDFALGDKIPKRKAVIPERKNFLSAFKDIPNNSEIKIFSKAYNKKSAIAINKAGADVVYYDILKEDCADVKQLMTHSRFFVYTPRIVSDRQIQEIVKKIDQLKPDGVLVGNRGFLKFLNSYELHFDYFFNCFNDVDLSNYKGIPIISQELNFNEVTSLKNKNFIVFVHGDLVLMNSREKLKAPELVDWGGRHFRVRRQNNTTEILNYKQIGLFNKSREYLKNGIKYYYIDLEKNVEDIIGIYRDILTSEDFDDFKLRKGHTTGHFARGVL